MRALQDDESHDEPCIARIRLKTWVEDQVGKELQDAVSALQREGERSLSKQVWRWRMAMDAEVSELSNQFWTQLQRG